MKTSIIILLLPIVYATQAQNIAFEEVFPLPPAPQNIAEFDGVGYSSIAFADIDGDSDEDVLITGLNNSNQYITKLYNNDGVGNYTEIQGTPFEGVSSSSITFADIDGDNDSDVLIMGLNSSSQCIIKLYENDGIGNYSEVFGTPFNGFASGFSACSDIDGDTDIDILITGYNNFYSCIIKLYTNDGNGNYTEVPDTPFDGISGSITFVDVDNDSDSDVLIAGINNSNQYVTKLYTNDGSGSYAEVSSTPFEGVVNGSIAFADIDGDNDRDVLISGHNGLGKISRLYSNDGSGNYTEVLGTPFEEVSSSSIAFVDVDEDNDEDVLITGYGNNSSIISNFYINDGSGNYTEVSDMPFEGVMDGSIAFADVDGDSDKDVLITGHTNSYQCIAKLYINDDIGNFAEASGTPFYEICKGSIAFADINENNNQDVLITGETSSGIVSTLYSNDGFGNYSEVSDMPFEGVTNGSIAFADVDSDNDQDVLITGDIAYHSQTSKLYSNDGSGNYTEVLGTPFDGVYLSSIAFADVDNDNDQDVLITGHNGSIPISKLYINDGIGNYTEMQSTPFEGVMDGSIAFADVDGDNDQDVLITGSNYSGQSIQIISKLYSNDGTGNYTETLNTPFDGVLYGSIAFADIDGDGDQDVLITGSNNSFPFQSSAKLYHNNGSEGFSEASITPFDGVYAGSIAFADIDGDNDQDVLITGKNSSNQGISKLYSNDGSGYYTEELGLPFDGVHSSSIAFADVDGDNDPDILITGRNNSDHYITKLYRNITTPNVSIETPQNANRPLVYPIPTTGQITVNLKKYYPADILVYDTKGRIILKKDNINNPLYNFTLNAANGVYILEVRTQDSNYRYRLIKN